jgi:hypothetical protein
VRSCEQASLESVIAVATLPPLVWTGSPNGCVSPKGPTECKVPPAWTSVNIWTLIDGLLRPCHSPWIFASPRLHAIGFPGPDDHRRAIAQAPPDDVPGALLLAIRRDFCSALAPAMKIEWPDGCW